MNDLRDALQQLAERGSPRAPSEVANEVVDRLGDAPIVAKAKVGSLGPWRPMLLAAAAILVVAAVGVLVVARTNEDDRTVRVTSDTTLTVPTIESPTITVPEPAGPGTTQVPPSERPSTRWHTVDETSMPMPKGGRYNAVAGNRTTFVAVGEADENPGTSADVDGWVAWSTDGRNWHRGTGPFVGPGNQRVNEVVAVDGGFVAVGEAATDGMLGGAAVWRSDDGRSWERVDSPGPATDVGPERVQAMRGVAERNGVLVAAGIDRINPGATFDAAAWRSTDGGRNWSRISGAEQVPMVDGGNEQASAVAGGPKGFVIAGFETSERSGPPQARVWFSTDGLSWEEASIDDGVVTSRIEAVTPGGLGWVAVGTANGVGAAWTSADGLAWSRVPHSDAIFGTPRDGFKETAIAGVIGTANGLSAIGERAPGDPTEWTSPEGRIWTRRNDGPRAATAAWPQDVALANGRVVAVGWREVAAAPKNGPAGLPAIWVRDAG
jgi:hypothetical protein